MEKDETEALDLIWGIKAISKVIHRSERQTYHLCSTGAIPVSKVGNGYVAVRGKLVKFFLEGAQ